FGIPAIVAHSAAVITVKIFAEIMENEFPAAHAVFCVRNYFLQKLSADFHFRNMLSVKEFFEFFNVFIAVKSQTITFAAVTTSPAGFLIIALYTFGYIVVNHKSHIGLVNSHP